ncbi:urease accessory protein UreD [Sporosarcina sp. 179-K 8C2 HS]|uniref:urease accessory protein UreD n=1 Tax=Sporosarcina sp. 179-K 8C2 HS TaxID=3142387 RepID=UPI0039A3D1EE
MEQMTGELQLRLEDKQGKTIAKDVYFQGALKVMRPIYLDDSGQVCYYILNPGGGYLDGDRYSMSFTLDKKAQATITTQGSTKVYRTPTDFAYQETEIILNDRSYLEYLPDPLIAYQDAKYKQKNIFRMDSTSSLLYTDIITPGWSPKGDHFSYELVQLINEFHIDGELKVYDHLKLAPADQLLGDIGFLEGYTHLGSMFVIDEKVDDGLIDRLYETLYEKTDSYQIGLSKLPVPGVAIRVFGNSTQLIEGLFSKCHHLIMQEWFGKRPSPLRKY